ncbi:ParB/RepB/Spo0J family partition protein [Burkholderia multivorans]|uniref:ParB/RepB/Spo0J family partition protein n=1 Tax=Burkholderia multivorans TaxID=87883 RepID=UPI000CFF1AA6|nr:ParB/RepB/Spo0J family partition protein [Burkholderia multivorans]MBR8022454.1 ParB/RepB/Spo0J family partition protein [Burkholderia multivorans]MBU9146951.1 ParB/RepB/Spo0J family partition protein [Burkholderia multivorans]MBU9372512.1 ParB/RepB/Spo0J family partition protein [Burkholderia multivorans]MBU9439372.1 ParB/RepB/Spo0J family partition protein [Burkholderia multivorans]MBU9540816.1 ParB/RepB/Spo0J family partition protein [Burkholderia multivorans]
MSGKGRLDLTSRVRAGMEEQTRSATARLDAAKVVQTAHLEVADQLPSEVARRIPGAISREGTAMSDRRPVRIRVADTIPNPYNPRVFYDSTTISNLAESFGSQGQLEAIKVTRLPEFPDKWVIIDGGRRTRAAALRKDEFIEAEIIEEELEPKSLYLRAYHANKDRDEQTDFDDAYAWKKLLDAGVYRDQMELAAAVGRDPKHVSKVLQLTTLPTTLLEAMAKRADVVRLSHAYNLKLIYDRAGEAVAARWLKEVIDGTASVRKLEQVASEQSKGTDSKRSKIHYQSKFPFRASNGDEIGMLKQFADGRTELTLKGVTGPAQEELGEKLKELILQWVANADHDRSRD